MKIRLILCAVLLLPLGMLAQELNETHYRIYSFDKKKEVGLDQIVKDMKDADVLFYGESHNDSVTHFLEMELFRMLHEEYKDVKVSMEMFDSETQYIVDEYLAGKIKERYFKKDARAWTNYRDYRPLVEYAKENNLKVVAANAPFRYVSMVNKLGQESLKEVHPHAKACLPPLPYDTASGAEFDALMEMMQGGPTNFNVNQGQSLWNATMAYSIYKNTGAPFTGKILHLNGKFHTDRFWGIVPQLKKYNPDLKVKVISAFQEDSFPNTDYKQFKGVADYIIITDPKVPTTY